MLLHCIVQTKSAGGENLLTDSYYVAEKLRIENKAAFDILTTTPVNWFDIGVEGDQKFHKIMRAPVIRFEKNYARSSSGNNFFAVLTYLETSNTYDNLFI